MNAFSNETGSGRIGYVDALRAHWAVIAVMVVAAVAAAAAYSATAPKRYEAKAQVLVTPIPATGTSDTFLGIGVLRDTSSDPTRAVITAGRFVKTPQTLAAVRERLRTNLSDKQLLNAVDVTPVGQANILVITAKAASASAAAKIANAFAEGTIAQRTAAFQRQLKAVIESLSRRLAAIPQSARAGGLAQGITTRLGTLEPLVGEDDPTLQILTRAERPGSPSWPRPVLSIGIAFLSSLLLGVGIAIASAFFDPRIHNEDDLLLAQRLPILARVPHLRRKQAHDLLVRQAPPPPAVREAFRTLRANIRRSGTDRGFPRSVLVTSAMPREGKTMAATNLAAAFATAGERVVLVDGDLRRPMVATAFGIAASGTGFADVVLGNGNARLPTVTVPGGGELRLVIGSPQQPGIDLLDAGRVRSMLEQLQQQADVVIVDSPPLAEVADALSLADAVDMVLVAVRIGYSRRDKLDELREMFAFRGIEPAGFIVTTRRRPATGGYYVEQQPELATIAPFAAERTTSARGGRERDQADHGLA